jgi:2-hydroxy-6-oxonona-2,4-dienedioate hydrolase
MIWRCWGEGEPVVLFHGGSGSWNHWVRNIASLVEAGRQVWIPDLPGFGESGKIPDAGDADALPQPIEAAMQSLLGRRAVDLVGFSFGAMVACLLTARSPGRVRRLVLSGAPALGIDYSSRLVLKPWVHLPPGPALQAAHRENLARLMFAKPGSNDELALALHSANLARDRMTSRKLSRTDIVLQTLPDLTCPVWGIWGEEDILYRGANRELAQALSRAPGFRGLSLIPGAGHWVQFEASVEFDSALRRSLAP